MSYKPAGNTCTFMGRVASALNLSQVQMGVDQNGQPNMVDKAMFKIAVSRKLTAQQRQKMQGGDTSIKDCDFVPLSATGAIVKFIQSYCPQGKGILVTCHYVEYSKKDPQTGQTTYGHVFEVDDIDFATQDSKALQNGTQQTAQQNQQPQNTYNQGAYQQPQQAASTTPPPASAAPQNNFSMFDTSEQPF